MRKHAIQCFGQATVDAAINREANNNPDGSIFAAFARAGQRPVTVSHRVHTNPEARAHIVQWVTESSRPPHLANDRGFRTLMTAGRPSLTVPSGQTVTRDIHTSFIKCKKTIDKLLQDYPGQLNYATDAWTSSNHRAFVAWSVHLHHEGSPLSFLLDIIEVPESHTGKTLANAFDQMLASHGLSNKILSWTGDNASSNDTQTTAMSAMPTNSFQQSNRVRCFAHTINLIVKSILKPFSAPEKKKKKKDGEGDGDGEGNGDGDVDNDDDSIPDLASLSDTSSMRGAFDDEDVDMDLEVEEDYSESDDEGEDVVDGRAALGDDERVDFDAETKLVKKSLEKVRAAV
ncbi:dimer-Tnp-hAT domain-containing protein [Favolaschia claudopus]|uniref:Dimer-Tnp-hAT domain-containing protein n=1 Tax=Favolaschia claudopus TaxID=2862362 RepID=A0AAV9ZKD2_9AGAR